MCFCFVHFYKLHNYNFTLKMLLFHFHFFLLVFECFCFLCVIVCLRQSLLVLHAIRLFSKIQNKRTLNVSMISRLVWLQNVCFGFSFCFLFCTICSLILLAFSSCRHFIQFSYELDISLSFLSVSVSTIQFICPMLCNMYVYSRVSNLALNAHL